MNVLQYSYVTLVCFNALNYIYCNLTSLQRGLSFLHFSFPHIIMSAAKESVDQNFDYMFKLLIIGNSSVGKTSFLVRYAEDSFTSAFVSTVGIDFKVKTVFRQDKRVKLQIWVCLPIIKS